MSDEITPIVGHESYQKAAAVLGRVHTAACAIGTSGPGLDELTDSCGDEMGIREAVKLLPSALQGIEKYLKHLPWLSGNGYFSFPESLQKISGYELKKYRESAKTLESYVAPGADP
jgi:hypothetical protein